MVATRPCAAGASAPALSKEDKSAQALEQLARVNFGELSAAEQTLIRAAAHREPGWAGAGEAADNPANDPANGKGWAPGRSIRAGVLEWLCTDPEALRYEQPSGVGIIAAR